MRQQLNATEAEVQHYEQIASAILYSTSAWRAGSSVIAGSSLGPSALWAYGISGDYPLVLLRIGEKSNSEIVRQLVKAHAFWRSSGLAVDLLIWNEDRSGYRQSLQGEIMGIHRYEPPRLEPWTGPGASSSGA